MKVKGNDKRLESFKIFPFVAWGLVFIFAWFVYTLATDLQATAHDLKAASAAKEERAKSPVESIADFEI